MTEEQAIKKIQLLKVIQPAKHTLKSIREDIYQQMQSENRAPFYQRMQDQLNNISPLMKSYSIAFYAGIVASLLIIFASASALFLPNQTHNALLIGKIFLAPNQYEKARIALNDTKSRFADKKTTQANTHALAYALSLTNAQLNALKLKGEKGKYTAQECHDIYREYLIYLEKEENNLSINSSLFRLLRSQINLYEEQAEEKLQHYNKSL